MKSKRLKYLFLGFALFLISQAKGQVADLFSFLGRGLEKGAMVEHLQNIERSTKVLNKSQESLQKVQNYLKTSKEYLNKVSAIVHKVRYIDKATRILSRARNAQNRTNQQIKQVYGHLSEGKLTSFLSSSNSLISRLSEDLEVIEDILKDGTSQMRDFERMSYMDAKLEKMERKTAEIEFQERQLLNMASMERVLNRIK